MDPLTLHLEVLPNHLGVVIHASTALNRILAHLLCCVRLGLHVEENVEALAVEFRQAREEYCIAHPDNVLPFDHTLGRISVSRAFYDGIVNIRIRGCIATLILLVVLVFARVLVVNAILLPARELLLAWEVLEDR